jgi:hypothetical protein
MYPRVLFRISGIFDLWNCLEGSGPRDGTTTMVLLEPLLCLIRALIRGDSLRRSCQCFGGEGEVCPSEVIEIASTLEEMFSENRT